MGWAVNDLSKVEEAKLQLSHTKSTAYRMYNQLIRIEHTEKRIDLLKQFDQLWSILDSIERQLNR